MHSKEQTFANFIETQLNPEQKKAVTQNSGSLLVVAGAGSGKTRVITARIANLIINEKIDPTTIIAVTFTNKAALEMKERIIHFLGNTIPDGYMPFIGTFHSYCLRLLKQHSHMLRHPFASILDEDDRKKIISDIIKRNNLQNQISAKQISYSISHIKSRMLSPTDNSLSEQPQMIQEIFHAYEQEKHESKALDFDDLLLEAVYLFEKHADIKEKLQQQTRHILVDEYQDTNATQHALLKHLALKEPKKLSANSVCIVGDEDQSIYSWRGATISNMLNIRKDFPNTITIKIEQNYRSVQPILHAANTVIQNNKYRNPKKLWSARSAQNRVAVLSCMSEYQEADTLVEFFKAISQNPKKQTSAVLYRAHYQSRSIEECLIKNSIPYTIIGGVQFYERKEIKDLLAYLRLVVNPFDRAAFFRVINCPTRGLGKAFEELFYEKWHAEPFLSFKDIAQKLIDEDLLPRSKKLSLSNFLESIKKHNKTEKPSEILSNILDSIKYQEYLKKTCGTQESDERIQNIKELFHAIEHFEEREVATLEQFLDEVSLLQEQIKTKKEDDSNVLLMTLHAAKGLEFDNVAIVGLNQGVLPSGRSLENEESLEEERRLLYVGITRAQERLLLTHSRYRYTYGQVSEQQPSQFVEEVPKDISQHKDICYWKTYKIADFFARWMGNAQNYQSATLFTFGSQKKSPRPVTKQPTTNKKKYSSSRKIIAGTWRKNQPVSHPKFGIGIINKIENKDEKTYATVNFKSGSKKIDTSFLKQV